jgi:hypothetical protein
LQATRPATPPRSVFVGVGDLVVGGRTYSLNTDTPSR